MASMTQMETLFFPCNLHSMCDADLSRSNNLGWKRHSVMTTSGLLIAHICEAKTANMSTEPRQLHFSMTDSPEQLLRHCHWKLPANRQRKAAVHVFINDDLLDPESTSNLLSYAQPRVSLFPWQLETSHVPSFKVRLAPWERVYVTKASIMLHLASESAEVSTFCEIGRLRKMLLCLLRDYDILLII